MKNWLFFILVIILLAVAGWLFYSGWSNFKEEEKITAAIQSIATPTPTPSEEPIFEPLPLAETVSPTPTYQKPAEDAIIKFPIFNYHHIRPMPDVASSTITDRAFTVTPEGFEAHLKYFQDNNYQAVSIYDLLNYFDTGKPLPPKAMAITFDDGYYGHYQWAYPLLKKYGLTATFFIITDSVGKPDMLTWEQIKEMSDNGMFVGSHSLSHANLAAIGDEQLRRELADSKKIIEEKIGKTVDLLAYPGGNYNEHVIGLAKETGYQAALSVYKIIDQAPKYRYAIRRFHADDALESITSKLVDY